MSPLWLFFPICFVTSLVLAGAREEGAKSILVRATQTFAALCAVVAAACVVLWALQAFAPTSRQFLIGVCVLVGLGIVTNPDFRKWLTYQLFGEKGMWVYWKLAKPSREGEGEGPK